jgi:integrase/recombinase XerC
MRLDEAIELYCKSISIHMADGSVKAYRSRLDFAKKIIGADIQVTDLRRSHLENVVIAYRKQGYKNTSTHILVVALRQLCEWCVDEELIGHSPAERLRSPKPEQHVPRSLSATTAMQVIAFCKRKLASEDWRDVRNAALCLIMLYTGIRREEARHTDWKDIDVQGKTITVLGKGKKERKIPLHAQIVPVFQNLQRSQKRKHGALFARADGTRLSKTHINNIFRDWLSTGIETDITPHMLRHTFATLLKEKGADLDEIKELLGHESVSTTQIYVKTSAERLRQAVDRF